MARGLARRLPVTGAAVVIVLYVVFTFYTLSKTGKGDQRKILAHEIVVTANDDDESRRVRSDV